MTLTKAPITVMKPERGEYGMRFELRHRRWDKSQPETQAAILKAGADYLETMAAQMREEAALLVDGSSTR